MYNIRGPCKKDLESVKVEVEDKENRYEPQLKQVPIEDHEVLQLPQKGLLSNGLSTPMSGRVNPCDKHVKLLLISSSLIGCCVKDQGN